MFVCINVYGGLFDVCSMSMYRFVVIILVFNIVCLVQCWTLHYRHVGFVASEIETGCNLDCKILNWVLC